ncbi:MAG: toprim domain-containing protein, partial [Gemmatimonadales bacterium]|nr:toprim domain-containing protein [Gemmatimonadales bacterium]
LAKRVDGTIAARFWSRLLFPIRDLRGRVVGFGGRRLDDGEPKYLNSPESPIYHKGTMLYNLHAAKQAIRREESLVLVEGYFDVLRLVMAGIDNVVAPLGTALTADQAALLRRFAPAAVLLLDSDKAGLRATFHAGEVLLQQKMRVRVATLPEGEDPDTLTRQGGAAALAPILHDAVDLLDRKIQLLERKGWFEGLEHRRDALDKLLPTARAAADPIARDLYIARIAEVTGVSRAVLEQELASRPSAAFTPSSPPPPASRRPDEQRARPVSGRSPPGARIEAQLLEAMFASPEWRRRAAGEKPPLTLHVPSYREVFAALAALPASAGVSDSVGGLSERAQEVWERIAKSSSERVAQGFNFDAEYAGIVERLREAEQLRELETITDPEVRRHKLQSASEATRAAWARRQQAAKAHRVPHS